LLADEADGNMDENVGAGVADDKDVDDDGDGDNDDGANGARNNDDVDDDVDDGAGEEIDGDSVAEEVAIAAFNTAMMDVGEVGMMDGVVLGGPLLVPLPPPIIMDNGFVGIINGIEDTNDGGIIINDVDEVDDEDAFELFDSYVEIDVLLLVVLLVIAVLLLVSSFSLLL
jgi:hypothetical protein